MRGLELAEDVRDRCDPSWMLATRTAADDQRIADLLKDRMVRALREAKEQCAIHTQLTEAIRADDEDRLQDTTKRVVDWECDNSRPSPYLVPKEREYCFAREAVAQSSCACRGHGRSGEAPGRAGSGCCGGESIYGGTRPRYGRLGGSRR